MRDTENNMVTTSKYNTIETLESIVQGEENGMQHDVEVCEYDSNTLQQKTLFELHGIGNVILKDRQKKLFNL